jgi:uncharacterized protein YqjF (DUF2071 family)
VDFPYDILHDTAHRPWPMPSRPWMMTQSWHDLLFAHWPVDPQALRRVVPAQLPLDLHDGQAWVGVVPFHMTNVAPRVTGGVGALAFPELNVRTYVTLGGKPGVYFFSLDAASRLAVAAARLLVGLPYFTASMAVKRVGHGVRYASRRASGAAELVIEYEPVGESSAPRRGTLDYFLAERYCLYVVRRGYLRRLEIHHPRWMLHQASATIEVNTMAAAAGITLPVVAPRLLFAKRQDAVAWWSEHPGRIHSLR